MELQFVNNLINLLIFYMENAVVVDPSVVLSVLHNVAKLLAV